MKKQGVVDCFISDEVEKFKNQKFWLVAEKLISKLKGVKNLQKYSTGLKTTVVSENERNENPDLTQGAVEMSGTSIPLDEVAAAPSCDAEVASVAADETHDLLIELGSAALESGEQLQVSLFSTDGHLERQFTFVDEGQTSFSIQFEAGTSEEAVKQYLVVRDLRGGVSWVSWNFCQR